MSKTKDAAAVQPVMDYLRNQNRPYSAIDIFNNLHKEHGKTSIIRALELLSEDGKIREKTYGKQKVYFAEQSQFLVVDDDELRKMDAQVNNLTLTLKEVQQSVKSNENLLSTLNNSLTTEEVKARLCVATKEISTLETKLKDLQSSSNHVSPQEKDKINKANEKYVKEWKKRKRTAVEMTDAILEGYPKSKKVLFEEIGMETDEDAKVSLPK